MADRGRGRGGGRGRGDGGGRGRGDGGSRGRGESVPRGRGDSGSRGRGDGGRGRGDGQGRGGYGGRGGRGQDRGRGGGLPFHGGNPRGIFEPPEPLVVPSAEVNNLENLVVTNQKNAGITTSVLGLAARPEYSSKGEDIILRTNYFELSPTQGIVFHRYDVSVGKRMNMDGRELKGRDGTPSPLRKRTRTRIMEILLGKPTFTPHAARVASDYASIIVSTVEINLGGATSKSSVITYFEKETPEDQRLKFEITVTYGGRIQLNDLMKYLYSSEPTPAYDQEEKAKAVQALNIITSKKANEAANVVCFGQNKFYAIGEQHNMFDLGGALIAIRGYYCSVRTSTRRLLVNVNVCTSPFYTPGKLVDLMDAFDPSGRNLFGLRKFLRMLKVETHYLKNRQGQAQQKVMTVFGLAHRPKFGANAQEHSFEHEGSNVTVEQYFKKRYNIVLEQPKRPLINCGNHDNPAMIPPEVCTVRAGQRYNAPLSPAQTANMIRYACRFPKGNAVDIVNTGAPLLGLSEQTNTVLRNFGMSVQARMITVPARILPAPEVGYINGPVAPNNGSWNMINKRFKKGAEVKNWSYMIVAGRGTAQEDIQQHRDTARMFQQRGLQGCGLTTSAPSPSQGFVFNLDYIGAQGPNDIRSAENVLQSNFQKLRGVFEQMSKTPLRILLVILPNENPDIYCRIKFLGDVKFGIHTVCTQAAKIGRRNAQYFANVALKFNLKLGGSNQSLTPTQLGVLGDGKTMVLGIDVTHPSPGSQEGAPSVAGVVANINGECTQWPASIMIQEGKKEMVAALTNMVADRLSCWKQHSRGTLPTKIVVYRDGVSEGQYQSVLREEVPAIFKGCEKAGMSTGELPKITVIICGKRHHTRFYPTRNEDGDQNGNCKNGTVVDRGIIRERESGFFLQAHHALQGTARSCNYSIIRDDIGLRADGIETMTHNLCYLFGRATTAVSLCPPAYYADLLCERGRQYLRKTFAGDTNSQTATSDAFNINTAEWTGGVHVRLQNSMFYI